MGLIIRIKSKILTTAYKAWYNLPPPPDTYRPHLLTPASLKHHLFGKAFISSSHPLSYHPTLCSFEHLTPLWYVLLVYILLVSPPSLQTLHLLSSSFLYPPGLELCLTNNKQTGPQPGESCGLETYMYESCAQRW